APVAGKYTRSGLVIRTVRSPTCTSVAGVFGTPATVAAGRYGVVARRRGAGTRPEDRWRSRRPGAADADRDVGDAGPGGRLAEADPQRREDRADLAPVLARDVDPAVVHPVPRTRLVPLL